MRAFNRFYTERIGALEDRHEGLELSLAEARCLFTVDRLGAPEIGAVATELDLDLGYVSRLLSGLQRRGLLCREVSETDRRRRHVRLTASGAAVLTETARRSDERMRSLTSHLTDQEVAQLLRAMTTIQRLIDKERR